MTNSQSNFRLDQQTKDSLTYLSQKFGCSRTAIVKRAVSQYEADFKDKWQQVIYPSNSRKGDR